ncbi:MAG: peptidoglycan glycosyltransferase [Opitutales bacterium]|jgi:penicillin-binding protein 2|nr:peptidoglycan glycosyltransferase [Opitutales bacterium]MBT5814722.1 peptidoglycan glycosyltransferase [Opitutales bacterium]MBT6378924.1 peptidoglycan glycosyltransferase [Opitutales bacterium]
MNPEEKNKYQGRLWIFYGMLAILLSILYSGLFYRQLIERESHVDQEKIQNHRRILTPGPRGNILDREGRVLVANRSKFSAVVFLSEDQVQKAFTNHYRSLVRDYREEGKPIENYTKLLILSRAMVLESYLKTVNDLLGREEEVDANAISRHLNLNPLLPYPLVDNLTQSEFAILLESLPVESPVQLYVSTMRHYPYENAVSHALGYVGHSALEIESNMPGSNLKTFATKGSYGRNGIEKRFDSNLQGKTGTEIWVVDPSGYQVEPIQRIYPKKGQDIELSIDIDLQLAGEQGYDLYGDKGALIAIDINRLEILAMLSRPDYNLNDTAPFISNDVFKEINERQAWENKAIRGLYPPGSPFKLITAIAALKSGVIDDGTIFECDGGHQVGRRRFPCMGHHGEMDLRSAIQKSCNEYFYRAGLVTGPDNMSREAVYMRLNKPTNINLPNETARMITPSRQWKRERYDQPWYDGDTANMSIGQGFLTVTPLQLGMMVASIAKNEVYSHPSIIKQSPEQLAVRPAPKPLGLPTEVHKAILDGMDRVVSPTGTARAAIIEGVTVGGKTGTAQINKKEGNLELAWFVGFAPVENPQIAIVALVEGQNLNESFGGGAHAAPMARYVFQAYFDKHPEFKAKPEAFQSQL